MGNAQKALVMAAGIFLAIALITIAVIMFISAQDATKTAQANFSSIQTDLAQTSFTVYDNTTVSGSQVVNALRKFQAAGEFGVMVKTGKSPANVWYFKTIDTTAASATYGSVTTTAAAGSLDNVTTESHAEYINPAGKFKATVVRDKSNVVRGLMFTQQP